MADLIIRTDTDPAAWPRPRWATFREFWDAPAPERADLPELHRALGRTGRVMLRGPLGMPMIFWADTNAAGRPVVCREFYSPLRLLGADGQRGPADDATQARRLSARLASEVPAPRGRPVAFALARIAEVGARLWRSGRRGE